MITEGLKLAAGDALHGILARSTSTRARGVLSGMAVTGLVQSSSAVTVATIGFVNAGLLTLIQSLGVVYGANVGTTLTGWIVAVAGFSWKVEAFALPLIGLGMIAQMLRPNSRVGSVGQALAGFGLFFIGVDVLKGAFEGFAQNVDVGTFAPQGGLGLTLYVILGFFMTLLTQSSSAAIAITLTAAAGGVLQIGAAAAMVIGANVGTTSTAILTVMGASANARRVAAAHVIFNVLTGAVALALLPLLLWLVGAAGSAIGLQDAPAVTLALFHTVFNLLGLAIMWPLTNRLASYLVARFTTEAERFAKPQFLDRSALATSALAMEALRMELDRVAGHVRTLALASISAETSADRDSGQLAQGLRSLIDAVEEFVTDVQMDKLPEVQRGELAIVLRISAYMEDVIGIALDMRDHHADIDAVLQSPVMQEVAAFQAAIVQHIRECDPRQAGFEVAEIEARLRRAWYKVA